MYFWQMLLVNPTVFTVAVRTAPQWTKGYRLLLLHLRNCDSSDYMDTSSETSYLSNGKSSSDETNRSSERSRNTLKYAKPLKKFSSSNVLFSVADLGFSAFLTPGSGMENQDLESGKNILAHFSESLETVFCSVVDPDPGSGAFLTPGPGSGIPNRFFSGSRIPALYFLELSDKFEFCTVIL
jgi:hypothetical protein